MYNVVCLTNLQGLELLLVVLEEVVPLLTDLSWVQVVPRAHPTLEENTGHAMTAVIVILMWRNLAAVSIAGDRWRCTRACRRARTAAGQFS